MPCDETARWPMVDCNKYKLTIIQLSDVGLGHHLRMTENTRPELAEGLLKKVSLFVLTVHSINRDGTRQPKRVMRLNDVTVKQVNLRCRRLCKAVKNI